MNTQGINSGSDARESAAAICLSMLESTAGRAEKMVSIVMERLASVTEAAPPEKEGNKLSSAPSSFPPLFERIRELAESINRSLSGIEDVVRRLEL